MTQPRSPGPLKGWLNEIVLVPALTLLFFAPIAGAVLILGIVVDPALGPTEPFGIAVLLVGFLGAYAFAVYRIRGRHERLHGRYP